MPLKSFQLEFKTVEQGSFTGIASTPDQDLGDDICLPGCFAKTIQQSGKTRPLLFDHKTCIGTIQIAENAKGLACEGSLAMDVAAARDAHGLMKHFQAAGRPMGLSIGFTIPPGGSEMRSDGVRLLKEIKLYEISAVVFPMNEMATVTSMKSHQAEQKVLDALHQMKREILNALEK